jgi:hypothetical protein
MVLGSSSSEAADRRPPVGAGRHNHVVGLKASLARGEDVVIAVSLQPVDGDPQVHGKVEPRRIRLEVVGHLVLGGKGVRVSRERHARKAVMAGFGEQRQRVPSPAPGLADPLPSVEDRERSPLSLSRQVVPGRKTGLPATDHLDRFATAEYLALDLEEAGPMRTPFVVLAVVLVGCTSTSSTSSPSSTTSRTDATESPSGSASTSSYPALVGQWKLGRTCSALVKAMTKAHVTDEITYEQLQELLDNSVKASNWDPKDPCAHAAPPTEHSHTFWPDGRFNSYDENGEPVDDAPYTIKGDRVTIHNPDFDDATIKYRATATELTLDPVIPTNCSSNACRQTLFVRFRGLLPRPDVDPSQFRPQCAAGHRLVGLSAAPESTSIANLGPRDRFTPLLLRICS